MAEFVMRERSGFTADGGYDLLTREGALLGSVEHEPSVSGWLFGSLSGATYRLVDAAGVAIAVLTRPGTMGRMAFAVTAADGHQIGTLEQENAFMTPRLQVRASDGWTARLTGGGLGSGGVRTLTEGPHEPSAERVQPSVERHEPSAERVVGEVSQQAGGLGGFLSGTDTYLVRLSDALTGDRRLLAVVATACLDLILNAKEKSAGRGFTPYGL